MGLDPKQHEIIEIGMLSFSFTNEEGIISVENTYNELNDPGKPIPKDITKITGITDEDVKGKTIDWGCVSKILAESHLVICHNSGFDRNFLELQTPEDIQEKTKRLYFGCTIKDIDWTARGFESSKLEFLNFKLGYFYEAHRALTDCWATLNLLLNSEGSFDELKSNVKRKETLICAETAPFELKDKLKSRGYKWSDGTSTLVKCWWTCVDNDKLEEEKKWLDEEIYGRVGKSDTLRKGVVNAKNRYSYRAEELK